MLRESLTVAMRDACGAQDLATLRSITSGVAARMRMNGFTVPIPEVGDHRDAFRYILARMRELDRLPNNDLTTN